MHIFWDYTKKCNLKCVHCYNAPERAIASPDLSTTDRLKLVYDLAKQYRGKTLHFLGGESLTSDDFKEVCKTAVEQGFKIQVTTNGTRNDDELITFLYNNCSIVHVSLDGANKTFNDKIRGKGVFKAVEKFLFAWQKRKVERRGALLNLSFTVTSLTLNSYKQIIDFCLKRAVDTLTIQPVKLLGNAVKNGKQLGITAEEYVTFAENIARYSLGESLKINLTGGSKKLKEYIKWNFYNDIVSVESHCDSGIRQLRITSTGVILPCIMGKTASSYIQRKWETGNTTVSMITQSNSFREFTSKVHKASVTKGSDICNKCEYLERRECYPGCPVQEKFGPAMVCEALNAKLVRM